MCFRRRRKFGVFCLYRRDLRTGGAAGISSLMTLEAAFRVLISLAALSAAAALSACTLPDDQALTMVNRGKYSLYDCRALATQARESAKRERELAEAIEKASRGPAGELVINSVYRPEYLTVKGELQELEITANKKNCRNALRTQSDGVIQ
jgi:hypothetical protein